ncbi:MAG: winged helix-turn-helix domain-containing protein [Candidatus Entotheonellia bacterium]
MIYLFGDCELDEALYELCRAGVPVKLEPKAFRVLAYLIQHRDRVVTKDELLAKLCPGEFVTESALTRCIVKAHQAVQDDGVAQRVIKTVHGHGSRFVLPSSSANVTVTSISCGQSGQSGCRTGLPSSSAKVSVKTIRPGTMISR